MLVEQLVVAAPGHAEVFLDRVAALGPVGLEAVAQLFPGALWFDRSAGLGREPRGRYATPLASTLFHLGKKAYSTIEGLLHSEIAEVRYYAALLAVDIDAAEHEAAMRALLFDGDGDVARLALAFCRANSERAERGAEFVEQQLIEGGEDRDPLRARTVLEGLRLGIHGKRLPSQ